MASVQNPERQPLPLRKGAHLAGGEPLMPAVGETFVTTCTLACGQATHERDLIAVALQPGRLSGPAVVAPTPAGPAPGGPDSWGAT
jgi:hypothetical protein